MRLALVGGTGMIGSRLLAEALARGHAVTAAVHRQAPPPAPRLTAVPLDVADRAAVAAFARGHDAVASAYSPGLSGLDPGRAADLIDAAHESLLGGVTDSGVRRLLLIGGVGSLEASPGVDVVDAPFYDSAHRPYTLRNRELLRALRAGRWPLLDWTYLSPPLHVGPGERTGRYATDPNRLLRDAAGESRISAEDLAVAALDALEGDRHLRARFTAAYA